MFRKLVSNLPFSPALVGQIGFYARRLRKEEATRRIGLFMTVLALLVQSLTVFVPSTSANATSTNDLIPGGITSKDQVMSAYDKDLNGFKRIMTYNGITRAELQASVKGSINSRDYETDYASAWKSWGHNPRLSADQGEVAHKIDDSLTVYSRPLWRLDTTEWTKAHGSTYTAFVGNSALRGKFAILFMCGNLVARTVPTPRTPITVCRPGVGVISIYSDDKQSTDLPANSDRCKPKITVCRPGVGVISIYESERKLTDLDANSEQCKPKTPLATCSSLLEPVKIDRTHFNFKANATAQDGATVSAYVFTVHKGDKNGAVVMTKTVSSAALSAESGAVELKDAGQYYVDVTVKTSLGDRTSPDCAKTLVVVPPEKCDVNPSLLKNDAECKPCPGNHDLWYKAPECREVVLESKSATNLTQGTDATKVTAQAGDRIQYHLTISNPGKVPATASFTEDLSDVLEYSTIQDNGGATYKPDKSTLTWDKIQLAPGEKQTRTFIVALPATIPSKAQGSSEPMSYDCIMNNTFGNNVQVKVQCDTPKVIEQTIKQLPSTGPTENMIFAAILLAIVTFFWARSRQLGSEVRLIRKDFSTSTI